MATGRVLVFGADGQVGRALLEAGRPAGFDVVGATRREVDITDAEAVRSMIGGARPAVVINAGAFTAVDRAEAEPEVAMAVNRDGAANIAAACAEAGCALVHLSTDYVFDGTKVGAYDPHDPPSPMGVYGRTKLAGEQAVAAALPAGHLIVRTAWVFSAWGHNFVRTMWRLSQEREELRVVADQVGNPTPADALAADLLVMGAALAAGRCPSGTYHWAGRPETSWHGFAEAIVEEARRRGPVTVRQVEPIATSEYPTPAARPANSVLDTRRTQETFGLTPPDWRAGLMRVADILAIVDR